jgi:hypothetical protein
VSAPVSCGRCGSETSVDATAGWIIEERRTVGGDVIRVVVCFPCRGHVEPSVEAQPKRCGGKCDGLYEGRGAWVARCDTYPCEEVWSCWDEQCVRDWAAEHGEPHECSECHQDVDHDVTVTSAVQRARAER